MSINRPSNKRIGIYTDPLGYKPGNGSKKMMYHMVY